MCAIFLFLNERAVPLFLLLQVLLLLTVVDATKPLRGRFLGDDGVTDDTVRALMAMAVRGDNKGRGGSSYFGSAAAQTMMDTYVSGQGGVENIGNSADESPPMTVAGREPATARPSTKPKKCPSSVSSFYQSQLGSVPCETDIDCESLSAPGGNSQDKTVCCLETECICGILLPGGSGPTCTGGALDHTQSFSPDVALPQPIAPTKTHVAPPPATVSDALVVQPPPSLPPKQPGSSDVVTCPSPLSASYQEMKGDLIMPCTKNTDCMGFLSTDGPPCCLHPYCICGDAAPGSGQVKCLTF